MEKIREFTISKSILRKKKATQITGNYVHNTALVSIVTSPS